MAPVDIALILFGTMQHLHSVQQIEDCWCNINRCLKPGGLLIVELPHFEDIYNAEIMEPQFWETDAGSDGTSVVVEFGTEDDQFDPESQVLLYCHRSLIKPVSVCSSCIVLPDKDSIIEMRVICALRMMIAFLGEMGCLASRCTMSQ